MQFFRLATIMRIPCGAKWFKRAQNPTQEVRRCTIPEKGGCSMTGIYQHTLDAKGRLFIPAKLREELGETFYVTISPEKCPRLLAKRPTTAVSTELNNCCKMLLAARGRAKISNLFHSVPWVISIVFFCLIFIVIKPSFYPVYWQTRL